MSIIQRIRDAFTKGVKQIPQNLNQSIQSGKFQNALSASIPGAAVVKSAKPVGGSIATAAKGAFNYVKRQFNNPFAGISVREGLRNIAKNKFLGGATAGATAGLAYGIAKATTGANTTIGENIRKSTQAGIAFGLNPLAAAAGLFTGGSSRAITGARNVAASFGTPNIALPNMANGIRDSIPSFDFGTPNISVSLPQFSTPQIPNLPSAGASFNPSLSVGSGGSGEILPLLLALGAIGGGAYLLGKKKRKKRKYKKRRRR
jgi:hypothetical protein